MTDVKSDDRPETKDSKLSNADPVGSGDEIEAEVASSQGNVVQGYVPKNPMIRPEEVKISELMQELMGDDKQQEQLHRVLGSTTDRDNENALADHIQKVFEVLIDSYPGKALEKLEEVSWLIRNGHDLSKFLTLSLNRDYRTAAGDLASYIEKTTPLFIAPKAGEDDDDAPAESAPVCSIQDLLADARLFEWAGISFGQ